MNYRHYLLLVLCLLVVGGSAAWLPGVGARSGELGPDRQQAAPRADPRAPVADCAPDDEFEDNDTLATAYPVAPGVYGPLVVCLADRVDLFAIDVPAGHTLHVDLTLDDPAADLGVDIRHLNGTAISGGRSAGDRVYAEMTSAETASYFVQVEMFLTQGTAYTMRLRISCADCLTYQGRLQQGGAPANGEYEFVFRLYDAAGDDGQLLAGPVTRTALVEDGLFVTDLYFGDTTGVYSGFPLGTAPYLEIAARPAGSALSFTTLSPRQQLTAAPVAHTLRAGAVISGSVDYPRAGLVVHNDTGDGLRISSSRESGMYVPAAGYAGLWVERADRYGVLVDVVGTPSTWIFDTRKNGIQVASAEGNGLVVGRADLSGVTVASAGVDGFLVEGAGDDGLQIGDGGLSTDYGLYTADEGVTYTALLVGTRDGNGEWALSTSDKIMAGNLTTGSQTLLATVAEGVTLRPGDVAAVSGLGEPLAAGMTPLAVVRPAEAERWEGVVGVVSGRMRRQAAPGKQGEASLLMSAEGAAQPGEYVALTVLGTARVRVESGSRVTAGQRLTAAAGAGTARALDTVVVDGVEVAENVPTVGVALGPPDEAGMVWVLVNPR